MGKYLFFYLAVLLIAAIFFREDFIFTLVYLLLGTYFVSRWWGKRTLDALVVYRRAPERIFLGEQAQVRLEISNTSWLPSVWLHVRESLPPAVTLSKPINQVATLAPKGTVSLDYRLEGRRRGYYPIGPLKLHSGDIFGVVDQVEREFDPNYLTVYPKIIPFTRVPLPSHSPLGTLRHTQPVFEDPTRVIGKRDYVDGDSLRAVDWKTTGKTGKLQVKKFEPSIEIETQIFLNLDARDFNKRTPHLDTELAIVVAASIANWIIAQRQSVGLVTNGVDPLPGDGHAQPVPPRRGRNHLMRILDVLARIEPGEWLPLVQMLHRERVNLTWGMTQILITPAMKEDIFDALFLSRRSGLDTVILLTGHSSDARTVQHQAGTFGFPVALLQDERDLDIWRH